MKSSTALHFDAPGGLGLSSSSEDATALRIRASISYRCWKLMYSNRSPPTVPAGIESPYISIPGRCGIAPSTGISRSRRYSSIPMSEDAILHRQDNAELRVAAHHSRVGLAGFLDRVGFDHRAHAGQFG